MICSISRSVSILCIDCVELFAVSGDIKYGTISERVEKKDITWRIQLRIRSHILFFHFHRGLAYVVSNCGGLAQIVVAMAYEYEYIPIFIFFICIFRYSRYF
jgi:hypothetical protein